MSWCLYGYYADMGLYCFLREENKMDHLTFFKDVKSRILSSYVFLGGEEFVKERALDEIKLRALEGGNEDFNLQILDENAEIIEVYEAASILPFMGTRRLVIWNNPKVFTKEMSSDNLDLLNTMLTTLHDAVCLVIVIKGAPDKRRKYYKILKENSMIVEFNPLTDFEAAKWVGSYFKKHGKEIDLQTAEEIVSMVGTSVMDLNNEVGKIYVSMGERLQVEKQDLKVLSGNNISFDVFEMVNCFRKGDNQKAMGELYRLLKRGDSGFMILGAVSSKLRGYYQAKIMLEGGMQKSRIITEMGGGYGAKRSVEECTGFSMEQLKCAIDALEYADYAVKNGLMSEAAAVEYAVATAFVLKD